MLVTFCLTVTLQVALAPCPSFAETVIVCVPAFLAVILPVLETDATELLDDE